MYEAIENLYSRIMLVYYKKLFSAKDREYCDLRAADMALLEVVYHMKTPHYGELARFANMSMPNLTYRINRLIEKGYLARNTDEEDKRKHTITVTGKYLAVYNLDKSFLETVIREITEQLSDEEKKVVDILLAKVNQKMTEVHYE